VITVCQQRYPFFSLFGGTNTPGNAQSYPIVNNIYYSYYTAPTVRNSLIINQTPALLGSDIYWVYDPWEILQPPRVLPRAELSKAYGLLKILGQRGFAIPACWISGSPDPLSIPFVF